MRGRNNKTAKRRILSVALAFLMIVTFIPVLSAPTTVEATSDWPIVKSIVENIYGETKTPLSKSAVVSSLVTAGSFVGTGTMGVVAGGQENWNQRYYIAHNDMWGSPWEVRSSNDRMQDGFCSLGGLTITPEAGADGAGSQAAANYYMKQNILDAQIETTLQLKDVDDGDAIVQMDTWTSDSDDYVVTEITNNGAAPVKLSADVWVPEYYRIGSSSGQVDCINIYPYRSGVDEENNLMWVSRQTSRLSSSMVPNTSDYTARGTMVTKMSGTDFTSVASNGKGTVTGKFTVEPGATVSLVIYTRTTNGGTATAKKSGFMKEDIKTLDENRDAALSEFASKFPALDIEALKQEHRDWWKDYWLESYIQIPDQTVMKYYYGAQYALGCNHREDMTHPSSMFGVLTTQDNCGWGGRYFLNYNQEAHYYGAGSSNHVGAILPYAKSIAYMANSNINSTSQYGFNGLAHARTTSPFNLYKAQAALTAKATSKNISGLSGSNSRDQKSNGTFTSLPMIWYYEYTMDQDYLRDTLYPFIYELMEFYLDYSEKFDATTDWPLDYKDTSDKWVIEDGYVYMINNSSVHESDYRDLSPGLDIGAAERLVRCMLEYSPILNVNLDKMDEWQDFLDHLCAYPQKTFTYEEYYAAIKNSSGNSMMPDYGDLTVTTAAYGISPYVTNNHTFVIEPWDQPVELEPVFPYESKTIMSDPEQVQRGIDTLKFMNSWASSSGGSFTWNGVSNSFSSSGNGLAKVYPIAARLGWDPADLITKFKNANAVRNMYSANLLCGQGVLGGLEILGPTEFVNSLLMQSEIGKIEVFPNWIEDEDAYFTRLLAKGAFEVSSEYQNGEVLFVDITSKAGGSVQLLNPWSSEENIVVYKDGQSIGYTVEDGYITFETQKGATYNIQPLGDGNTYVRGIALSKSSVTLDKDDVKAATSTSIAAYIRPAHADNQAVVWESLDTSIATVTPSANPLEATITAVGGGTTKIVATTVDGGFISEVDVLVYDASVPVDRVVISGSTSGTIYSSVQLSAIAHPTYLADRTVTWESLTPTIATVNANGRVSLLKVGTATIRAYSNADSSVYADYTVTVNRVDNSTLSKQVDYALTLTEEDFETPADWNALLSAIEVAQTILSNGDATASEIADALADLNEALSMRVVDIGIPYHKMTDGDASFTETHAVQLVPPSSGLPSSYYWRLRTTSDGDVSSSNAVIDPYLGLIWATNPGTYKVEIISGSVGGANQTLTAGDVITSITVTFSDMTPSPNLATSGNGSAFGSTTGSYPPSNVFDGSASTFFEHNANTAYFGWDFGTPVEINVLKFLPRSGVNGNRAFMGTLQGSNTSSSSGFVDLYTFDDCGTAANIICTPQTWNVKPINTDGQAYRYYRWVGAYGTDLGMNGTDGRSRGNMAEMELYLNAVG